MNWTQTINPYKNIAISSIVAVVPIIFIFWALIIKKMKGYQATISATLIAILIAVFSYHMPINLALLSTLHGILYGLFPICWIIIGVIFLFNITLKSGQFEVIKYFMSSISDDRRLQALLIAFSFGAFLEGTAGFGAPVAITASMLIGLGFDPLYAAGICLVANTAPVAFGSIGIPITIASQVSGIPEMAISQMVGRTLPLLSFLLPFYLIILMSGLRKSIEVLPAIIVSGLSFAIFQFLFSNFLGPRLPDVVAGIASIISLMLFLQFWKPKSVWRFKHEPPPTKSTNESYSRGQIFRAWSPFIILTLIILAWGLQPVKNMLDNIGFTKFGIPGLNNVIKSGTDGGLIQQVFKFNYLSASGTAIMLSAIISIPLTGLHFKDGLKVFFSTLNQLKYPILTIASVLGFAYIINNSGISLTMAKGMASTGVLFPFFAPILGWLGVFITGSDTSSNALFAQLQSAAATAINVNPVVTVSANCTGGVVGKMISPQSIAVGTAAVGLVGKESDLFRFTVKHSFIILLAVCIITVIQAYMIPWIIPSYTIAKAGVAEVATSFSKGTLYLISLAIIIACVCITIFWINRKEKGVLEIP